MAEASRTGDRSAAHVLEWENIEQVAVWHGKTPPRSFAVDLFNLGAFYNWAYEAVEFTGPGAVTCRHLYQELFYPELYQREQLDRLGAKMSVDRPGFVTSSRTKKIILDELAALIRQNEIILHHEDTITELREFQYDYTKSGQKAYSAPENKHDDLVMALAIACIARKQYVPMPGEDLDKRFNDMARELGVNVPETPRERHRRRLERGRLQDIQGWGQD